MYKGGYELLEDAIQIGNTYSWKMAEKDIEVILGRDYFEFDDGRIIVTSKIESIKILNLI